MTNRAVPAFALGLLLLALAGCQRPVSEDKSLTLQPGDIVQPAIVPAPRGEQKVRVEVTASEPIDVDVALEEQKEPIMSALRTDKRPDAAKTLKSQPQTKSATLDVTIPAGKEYTVILSGARKKSDVRVKVNSQ